MTHVACTKCMQTFMNLCGWVARQVHRQIYSCISYIWHRPACPHMFAGISLSNETTSQITDATSPLLGLSILLPCTELIGNSFTTSELFATSSLQAYLRKSHSNIEFDASTRSAAFFAARKVSSTSIVQRDYLLLEPRSLRLQSTANPQTKDLESQGLDSVRLSIFRGGAPKSIRESPRAPRLRDACFAELIHGPHSQAPSPVTIVNTFEVG